MGTIDVEISTITAFCTTRREMDVNEKNFSFGRLEHN
jgi:hypothetical protein